MLLYLPAIFQAPLTDALGPVEAWGAQAWLKTADDDSKYNFILPKISTIHLPFANSIFLGVLLLFLLLAFE